MSDNQGRSFWMDHARAEFEEWLDEIAESGTFGGTSARLPRGLVRALGKVAQSKADGEGESHE